MHYQSHWRPEQDAVHLVNLSSAQDHGLKFWQPQSHAIIAYQSVPKDCVERVVSESGDRQLFTRQLRIVKLEADDRAILQIDLRVYGVPGDEIYKHEQYMQSISKQIEKLVEESLESNILSEEAATKIYEAGNCELHEVQERTPKCNVSVAKHTWKPDSKYAHAEESLKRPKTRFPA